MRQLLSQLDSDGTLRVTIADVPTPEPKPHEVLVRIEATPINPSDLGLLLAGVDVSTLRRSSVGVGVEGQVPAEALPGLGARFGEAMPVGNEGGGTVVAAGSDATAQGLIGTIVGTFGGAMYSEYRCVPAAMCMAMPDGVSAEQAASTLVNPLTALAMVDTMRNEGHSALVHTAAGSQLGRMLIRICLADGVPLVNVVRRAEHVDELRSLGAEHVVNSSADSFADDLLAAITATGATIAFDATGGGTLAHSILTAMEASLRAGSAYSRYGSDVHKQVYLYGGLDTRPLELRRGSYGMAWSVSGWLLTPFLQKAGPARMVELRERVAAGITGMFATEYGRRLTFDEVVDPDAIREYAVMGTNAKALILPHG